MKYVFLLAFFLVFSFTCSGEARGQGTHPFRDGSSARIAVNLKYDGLPLTAQAVPAFTCLDYGRNVWFDCRIIAENYFLGQYSMPELLPGSYRMDVIIDENTRNPRRFPGDYNVQHDFTVAQGAGLRPVDVDVLKIIHVLTPVDIGRPVDGMLTGIVDRKPVFMTGQFLLIPKARLHFSWEPLVDGATYEYWVVQTRAGSNCQHEADLYHGETTRAFVDLDFSPTPSGSYLEFQVKARRNGHPLGEIITYDGGAQSWAIRFVVKNGSSVTMASAAVLLLLILGGYFLVKKGWLPLRFLLYGTVAAAVLSAGGYYWQRALVAEREEKLEASDESFLAEWTRAVPRPEWWNEVDTHGYRIDSVGDLGAQWQTINYSRAETQKLFYKLCYEAVEAHPRDEHLVAEAIYFMHSAWRESKWHDATIRFWVAHFIDYKQRTNNCVNCLTADMSSAMVEELASIYVDERDPAAATRLIQSFINRRRPEISDYVIARLYAAMARPHWQQGQYQQALQDMEDALRNAQEVNEPEKLKRLQSGLIQLAAVQMLWDRGDKQAALNQIKQIPENLKFWWVGDEIAKTLRDFEHMIPDSPSQVVN